MNCFSTYGTVVIRSGRFNWRSLTALYTGIFMLPGMAMQKFLAPMTWFTSESLALNDTTAFLKNKKNTLEPHTNGSRFWKSNHPTPVMQIPTIQIASRNNYLNLKLIYQIKEYTICTIILFWCFVWQLEVVSIVSLVCFISYCERRESAPAFIDNESSVKQALVSCACEREAPITAAAHSSHSLVKRLSVSKGHTGP